jgi:protein TilB
MTKITQQLILKKSEHHDGLLADLEEISLHQLHIEKIEVIGSICRKLRILYLQNNLIGKIENINKLKDLRYLNLALNNIVCIENLEGCEKLERLDLTVNFVSIENLETSMNTLKGLIFFEDLYLVGNPCTDWSLYRPYVLANLPKLKRLDGKDVTALEREEARRDAALLQDELRLRAAAARDERVAEEARAAARAQRTAGKSRVVSSSSHGGVTIEEVDEDEEEEGNKRFTPELRLQMYREEQEQERAREVRPHSQS